ncbi:hypothetical protein QCA50_004643 [Cerrena zonata]|uniref:Uncharacterized protein n=1 Tax=Cerrena zonata TaxID=2478898 RepID=A0AAW0GJ60_9APHY
MSKSHKRSIQDTPVDLSKMRMALDAVKVLREDLSGITSTEVQTDLDEAIRHLQSVARVLNAADIPKLSCSSVTSKHLTDLRIGHGMLDWNHNTIAALAVERMEDKHFADVCRVLSQEIVDIYAHVNMAYETGSRMILEATLKALCRTFKHPQTDSIVSVVSELNLPPEGIKITHPRTGGELWLRGSVDYHLTCDLRTSPNRSEVAFLSFLAPEICTETLLFIDGVLGLNAYTEESILRDILGRTQNQMFILRAKHVDEKPLNSYLPEAVGQALALSQFIQIARMRFILVDGVSWMFCSLVKEESGVYTTYQSERFLLSKLGGIVEISKLLVLMNEWFSPSEKCATLFTVANSAFATLQK